MSVSGIVAVNAGAVAQTKLAPDGDTAAVEAAETATKRQAEKANGGFEPKTNVAPAASANSLGVNKVV